MNNIKKFFSNKNLNIKSISYNKNNKIINTDNGKYIVKNKTNNINEIHKYLELKKFNNYLSTLNDYDSNYEIFPYISEKNIIISEKAQELIYVMSMLHIKTTTYEEITEYKITEKYEEILKEIDYKYKYYLDLHDYIESKIYMSPAEYLLIINISKIYSLLNYAKNKLNEWYKNKETKERHVLLNNNLKLENFIISENNYLINWNKAKRGNVIYDFINLYKNEYLNLNMESLFHLYQNKYPYTNNELTLFYTLIAIPEKIVLNKSNYINVINVNKLIKYINKTHKFISEENKEKQENNKEEFK